MKKRNHFCRQLIITAVVLLASFPAHVFASDPSLPTGWSDGYLYANGIRIHYYHATPAPGKPVILAVHGVMDIGLSWASVGGRLQNDYDIYMLDTRGHGLSDPFNGTEDRNTLLTDVIEAAKALKIEKPILMGHSMGGAIVIRLGAEYPDFAKAIIVVDAGIGGGPRPPASPTAGNTTAQPARPASSPDAMTITMRGTPDALVKQNNYSFDELVAKAGRDNRRWSAIDRQYWATAIKRYHGPYSDEMWQTMSGTMRSEVALAKIQVPVVILKADATPEVRKVHQEQASVMQKGKLIHIDDSGHNLQRDQPQRAAEVIRDFLAKI